MPTRQCWYLPSSWTVLTIVVCAGFFLGRDTPKHRQVLGLNVITRGWPCVTDATFSVADLKTLKWVAENSKPKWYYPIEEVKAVLMPLRNRFPFLYTTAFDISFQIIATIVFAALMEAFVRRYRQIETAAAGQLRWHQISLATMLVASISAGAMIGLNVIPRRVEIVGLKINAFGWPWTEGWTWNEESLKRWQVENGKSPGDAPFGDVMDTLEVGWSGQSELSMAYNLFCGIVVTVCAGAAAEWLLRRTERRKKSTVNASTKG